MAGKERCEFLRNIRKNIAEMNNLTYEPHECTNEGWCPGFCPVCDAEAADLMRQLKRKEKEGIIIKTDDVSIMALKNSVRLLDDTIIEVPYSSLSGVPDISIPETGIISDYHLDNILDEEDGKRLCHGNSMLSKMKEKINKKLIQMTKPEE